MPSLVYFVTSAGEVRVPLAFSSCEYWVLIMFCREVYAGEDILSSF
jgi:hypothetical protein